MKAALTDKLISNLGPRSKQYELWDTVATDLYLRVSPGGGKTWMRRLYRDGERVREAFAAWPDMRVPEARDTVLFREATIDDKTTFGAVCGRFLAEATLADSTRREWTRIVANELQPVVQLNPSDADGFRRAMRALLAGVAKRSAYSRNRVFEVARRIHGWGVGQDMIRPAPVFAGFEKLPETPRERTFTDDELKAILAACALDYPEWRVYWKMLWLTGARRGTVLAARWEHIGEHWTVPSANLKGRVGKRRDTIIPIVPQLRKALDFQREITGGMEHVVSNLKTGGRAVNPQKAAARVRAQSGVDGWRVHDIRHAVSTGLAKLRVAPHVIDRVLHHASGSRIHRTYNAWEYLDEKTEALTKWAGYLDSLR